ncbi:MAG: hypothetical protein QXQ76_03100 [Candidatus Bathyarchaeia archaeon]
MAESYRLTDKGMREAEELARRLVGKFERIRDPQNIPISIAEALRRHGIESLVCLDCRILPVSPDLPERAGLLWELRFTFLGGNQELLRLGDRAPKELGE